MYAGCTIYTNNSIFFVISRKNYNLTFATYKLEDKIQIPTNSLFQIYSATTLKY